MNTKKIRIGNDIRLAVDLRQYLYANKYLKEREVYNPDSAEFNNLDSNIFVNKDTELYYPNINTTSTSTTKVDPDGTPISIRGVKAVFVNTTLRNEYTERVKKKSRFIGRFPLEPCMEAYHATPYDICNGGHPTWRAYPHQYCAAHYHGFGIHPCWEGIYKPLPILDKIEYRANVMATKKQNVVEVSFPATHQYHTGKYTLILVVKVYAPGFNHNNIKTITIDLPDVFELVKSTAEGVDGDVIGNVSQILDKLPYEVYVDDDTDDKEGCNCCWGDPDSNNSGEGDDCNCCWGDPDTDEADDGSWGDSSCGNCDCGWADPDIDRP